MFDNKRLAEIANEFDNDANRLDKEADGWETDALRNVILGKDFCRQRAQECRKGAEKSRESAEQTRQLNSN